MINTLSDSVRTSRKFWFFWLVVVIVILLNACDVELPQVDNPQTVEGFPIINENYNLLEPQSNNFNHFDGYNNPVDILGKPNKWPVLLVASPGNLEIYIQGAAGEFGIEQTLTLSRGCYGVKLLFDMHIHDRRNPENHVANVRVYLPQDGSWQTLGAKRLPLTSTSEQLFVFYVESVRDVLISGYYKALYATAGDNSMANLKSFQVIELPEGYC